MERDIRLLTVRSPAIFARSARSAAVCPGSVAAAIALLCLGANAFAAEPAAAGGGITPAEAGTGVVAAELNRTESVPDGCRLSFVIHNRTDHVFESMQWDLVLFDPDGLIVARAAAEAAPLPAGKTSVKLFDVPGPACKGLGRVLLNDILRCETGTGGEAHPDCIGLTVPSSRADVEFFK